MKSRANCSFIIKPALNLDRAEQSFQHKSKQQNTRGNKFTDFKVKYVAYITKVSTYMSAFVISSPRGPQFAGSNPTKGEAFSQEVENEHPP